MVVNLNTNKSAEPMYLVDPSTAAGVKAGSGILASVNFTPAAAAYGAGAIIDVAKEFVFTFADGTTPIPTGSLIRLLTSVIKIDATALISGEAAYTLYNYSVTPPSAQADQATWTLASADLPSYRGYFSLGTPLDQGTALHIKRQILDPDTSQPGVDIHLPGVSMFSRLGTVGGFTAAAVARQITLIGALI